MVRRFTEQETSWDALSASSSLALGQRELLSLCTEPRAAAAEWETLAADARATTAAASRWVGESTLLAVLPDDQPRAVETVEREAAQRGASSVVFAKPVDAGQPIAFFSAGIAARSALAAAGSAAHVVYDDPSGELSVESSGLTTSLDVEAVAFAALQAGYLPEALIACAVGQLLARAARLRAVVDALAEGDPAELRFFDGIPMYRLAGGLVADPVGLALVSSSGDIGAHAVAIRAAAGREGLQPPCTCAGPWQVRAGLRRLHAVRSFDSRSFAGDVWFDAIGTSHVLRYGTACDHVLRVPAGRDWAAEGWTVDDCRAHWRSAPVAEPVRVFARRSWGSHAVLACGLEVGSVAADAEICASLARRVGFDPGIPVTAYVPFANAVFFTDEVATTELRQLLDLMRRTGLPELLDRDALPVGPEVDYAIAVQVAEAPLDVTIVTGGREIP